MPCVVFVCSTECWNISRKYVCGTGWVCRFSFFQHNSNESRSNFTITHKDEARLQYIINIFVKSNWNRLTQFQCNQKKITTHPTPPIHITNTNAVPNDLHENGHCETNSRISLQINWLICVEPPLHQMPYPPGTRPSAPFLRTPSVGLPFSRVHKHIYTTLYCNRHQESDRCEPYNIYKSCHFPPTWWSLMP